MATIQGSGYNTTNASTQAFDATGGVFVGGDVGAEIAALSVENGEAERATAHEQRDAALAIEEQADAAQVQAMHNEASSMRSQGVFDCATSMASAVLKYYSPFAGAAVDAGQKLGDGFFGAAQKDDEATAAAQKAAANQAHDAAERDSDAASDANGLVSAALEFNRNYESTAAQTQLAALHRA